MLSEETTTITTEEWAPPCFVRHEDAGGRCGQPATIEVYGLNFCEAHGEEVRLGALLEAYQDAEYYFERSRNPHVPKQSGVVERALERTLARLHEESPSEEAYDRALVAAYPEIPEKTRRRVVNWQQDEMPGREGVLDTILREMHTLHKLLRIAHADGVFGWSRCWSKSATPSPRKPPTCFATRSRPSQTRDSRRDHQGRGLSWSWPFTERSRDQLRSYRHAAAPGTGPGEARRISGLRPLRGGDWSGRLTVWGACRVPDA